MSLTVPTDLLDRAANGPVDDDAFLDVVAQSLPYAWTVVQQVVADLHTGGGPMADHEVAPPTDAERGQLLRAMASDAIRSAVERRYGVVLAFQNCHRVAAFTPEGAAGPLFAEFISPRGQLLNQSPELRNC